MKHAKYVPIHTHIIDRSPKRQQQVVGLGSNALSFCTEDLICRTTGQNAVFPNYYEPVGLMRLPITSDHGGGINNIRVLEKSR